MLKVLYTEIVKTDRRDTRGLMFDREHIAETLQDAAQFSRRIANTAHIVGRPIIVEE